MAGRGGDHQGDGKSGDDAGFDWIYGSDDPEPTRRIPVQRRDPAPPSADRLPPPRAYDGRPPSGPGRPPPPTPAPSPGRRSAWSRPRTYVRLVIGLLVLWLAFLVAVPVLTWSKVDKVDFEPDGDRPSEQPGTTYLLVGSDSRAGLTAEERKKLHTGDAKSELTDTILLLHTGDGPTTLVSIPRDSKVPGKYKSGNGLVNGLFSSGGYPSLVRYLEDATGIRIDHLVEIGFGGLVDVVDAVDGIEICPKKRIKDKDSGLDVEKGCQQVDGITALAYARARKHSPLSDLARVQQQREVIAAVGEKVLSPWSVLNPFRYWNLNAAVPNFFKFGEGAGVLDAARWARAMTGVEKSCTMPITDASARSWDRDRADKIFAAFIEDDTAAISGNLCTKTGLSTDPPA